jgi:hypothetical protein
MNFQVPQFIEEKPKIVGFLTLPQFLYVAAAGILSFISFKLFSFFLWILITVMVAGGAIALAFVKINGRPLPAVVLAGFRFIWKPKVYTWQRAMKETMLDVSDIEKLQSLREKMSIGDKLKTIALHITTGKLFSPKQLKEREEKERFQVVTYLTGERKVAKRVDY